jgi:hypothetical protein
MGWRNRANGTSFLATALLGAALALQPASSKAAAASPGGGRIAAGGVLRVAVPEAVGGKTVIGQLTVDLAVGSGFVTAYGCADGRPGDSSSSAARSDLNYDGTVTPVASNRLIVKADNNGDVCFYTLRPVAMVIDLNAVTFDTGITSFANRRTDTRSMSSPMLGAGSVRSINVPEAVGGKTVVGQVTVDRATDSGFLTAYGCADGIPRDASGQVARSDLNYDGTVTPVASNRLIVRADANGNVCVFTYRAVALIVDINGASDSGIVSFANRRTDTRQSGTARVGAGRTLRVRVPEAIGGKTVIGQLTADQAADVGFVTAFGCADGLPTDSSGWVTRSDLNYDGTVTPVASNRLIVKADSNGEVCFYTLRPVALIVDINGVSGAGISSFPNRRIDTRSSPDATGTNTPSSDVPVWQPYVVKPGVPGVAALTGYPLAPTFPARPILAVKIDNYSMARPQWGLEQADAVIELNVEGVSRFMALYQTQLPSEIGPVRSARTADLDLLAAMNRPVFAYSGANDGVVSWLASAAGSGVLVDSGSSGGTCVSRSALKPGPHNLLLDPNCALTASRAGDPGPARPLWAINAAWRPPTQAMTSTDTEFTVPMDGVVVEWTWNRRDGLYERTQDGEPHVTMSGDRIVASNVVEIASVHVPSPVDARSPNPITVGTGAAIVHRNGRAIQAVWSRATPYEPFEFFDTVTGGAIELNVGVTFIELERAT